jgi:hypothetical protein
MSTVYTGREVVSKLRRRPISTHTRARQIKQIFGDEAVKVLTVPSVAADYNDKMGAVDIGDQLRASEGLDHRVRIQNWQVLAWKFLLEICLINTFLLQRRGKPAWKPYITQKAWRQAVLDEIIKAYAQKGSTRQRLRTGDEFTPISQHKAVQRGKKGPCLACKGYRVGESRQKRRPRPLGEVAGNRQRAPDSRWGCDVCDVALCTSERCWYFWHQPIIV